LATRRSPERIRLALERDAGDDAIDGAYRDVDYLDGLEAGRAIIVAFARQEAPAPDGIVGCALGVVRVANDVSDGQRADGAACGIGKGCPEVSEPDRTDVMFEERLVPGRDESAGVGPQQLLRVGLAGVEPDRAGGRKDDGLEGAGRGS